MAMLSEICDLSVTSAILVSLTFQHLKLQFWLTLLQGGDVSAAVISMIGLGKQVRWRLGHVARNPGRGNVQTQKSAWTTRGCSIQLRLRG